MNLMVLLGLGLALGLRHAADPDHVVAVTAITARTRGLFSAASLGMVWGLGHTLTLLAVGTGIILFGWVVPPRLGLAMEFVVALALVTVGLLNLRGGLDSDLREGARAGARPQAGRAFAIGLAHGLAGSAAVALLVLATVRDPRWACGYLLVFGAGTLIGMVVVTTGMALPLAAIARRWGGAPRMARVGTGMLSLVFGMWLVVQIGWHDGLFRSIPHWNPH